MKNGSGTGAIYHKKIKAGKTKNNLLNLKNLINWVEYLFKKKFFHSLRNKNNGVIIGCRMGNR
jgi:hypothetical protein